MQLRSPIAVLSALSAALTTGRSVPFEDTKQLLAASESAATMLNASISQTPNLNTSEMLQAIGYQIGASTANLNASNAEQGREPASDPAMDDVYFNYASSLVTLSEVLGHRRPHLWTAPWLAQPDLKEFHDKNDHCWQCYYPRSKHLVSQHHLPRMVKNWLLGGLNTLGR
ncbi:hypothetical protein KC365_g4511 [Hortaea werneckii]|nr:hypothetical protein KC339_g1485 [Hortaea werneckii]KAI7238159.1 hypothetical protein KC365_g4511 [Hortaea werneckii]